MDTYTTEFLKNYDVSSVDVTDQIISITFEDSDKTLVLEALADCCGHAYFEKIDDLDNLSGQRIKDIDWGDTKYINDVDHSVVSITTNDTTLTVYLCCNHNGYYPGFLRISLN